MLAPGIFLARGLVHRHQVLTDLRLAVLGVRLEQVHLRGADEPGHEQVDRPVVEAQRGVHLLQNTHEPAR